MTIKLAAAILRANAYGDAASRDQLKEARASITVYKNRETVITEDAGISLVSGDTVSG